MQAFSIGLPRRGWAEVKGEEIVVEQEHFIQGTSRPIPICTLLVYTCNPPGRRWCTATKCVCWKVRVTPLGQGQVSFMFQDPDSGKCLTTWVAGGPFLRPVVANKMYACVSVWIKLLSRGVWLSSSCYPQTSLSPVLETKFYILLTSLYPCSLPPHPQTPKSRALEVL